MFQQKLHTKCATLDCMLIYHDVSISIMRVTGKKKKPNNSNFACLSGIKLPQSDTSKEAQF